MLCYTIYMNKDINIRVFYEDYKLLSKIAKKDGRTLKSMFKIIINKWYAKHLQNHSENNR